MYAAASCGCPCVIVFYVTIPTRSEIVVFVPPRPCSSHVALSQAADLDTVQAATNHDRLRSRPGSPNVVRPFVSGHVENSD